MLLTTCHSSRSGHEGFAIKRQLESRCPLLDHPLATSPPPGHREGWEKVRGRGCRSDMNKPGAVHVDHITEAKDGLANFWDPANLQVLCKKHHGAKTLTVAAGRADPRSPNA